MIQKIEKLIDSPDTSVLVQMNRGYMNLSQEQYRAAIESFEAVLKIQPHNIAAANNRYEVPVLCGCAN